MRRPIEKYTRISSRHGEAAPGSTFGKHLGYDYACPVGTPVVAPVSGTIRSVSTGLSGGKQIELAGDDGRLYRFLHLSKQGVSPGQAVREGQTIALSGNTGRTTGPHLHCDVRRVNTAWNASFNNYYDLEALIAEANKPKPATTSTKGMLHLNKGTNTTFYRVSGGTFVIHAKDDTYDYTILEDQGYRVRVNSVSGGGNGWIYLIYQTGANKGKVIPGRKRI